MKFFIAILIICGGYAYFATSTPMGKALILCPFYDKKINDLASDPSKAGALAKTFMRIGSRTEAPKTDWPFINIGGYEIPVPKSFWAVSKNSELPVMTSGDYAYILFSQGEVAQAPEVAWWLKSYAKSFKNEFELLKTLFDKNFFEGCTPQMDMDEIFTNIYLATLKVAISAQGKFSEVYANAGTTRLWFTGETPAGKFPFQLNAFLSIGSKPLKISYQVQTLSAQRQLVELFPYSKPTPSTVTETGPYLELQDQVKTFLSSKK